MDVKASADGNSKAAATPIRRHRTAIQRHRCSRPVAIALADGLISKDTTVFDYGCGRGDDLKFLSARGIPVTGWDPHYRPDENHQPAQVVNLGYVLNVIENPRERLEALVHAHRLAEAMLIVSVRVDNALESVEEFGDGQLTKTGTFQKIYDQIEFKAYVEEALGVRMHIVGLGIAYVFKDEAVEARYLANRAFTRRLEYRTDLIEEFAKNKVARRYVRLGNRLGRVPLPEEFKAYDELVEVFGSPQRIERLLLRQIDRDKFEGSKEQRRQDIVTFLAMMRLQGLRSPTLGSLEPRIQADIRGIWKSHRRAQDESERFLFSIGEEETVREACLAAPVGKQLPEDLYVHVSAEDDLPALVRLIIFAAKCIVGEVPHQIVKIRKDGRAVSFLNYQDFDTDPHPVLVHSVRVHLPRARYNIRDFTRSPNPSRGHQRL